MWRSVALSAVTAPLNKYLSTKFERTELGKSLATQFGDTGRDIATGIVTGTATQLVRMQVYGGGKIDWATVASDAFGNAIGNSVVGALNEARVSRLTAKALARADLPNDLIDHRKTYEAAQLLVQQGMPMDDVVTILRNRSFRGMLGELDETVSGGLTDAQANARMLDAVEIARAARDPAPAVPVVAVARVPGGPEVVWLEEVVVTRYRRGKSGNDILQHAVAGGLAGLEALTQFEAESPWLAGGAYAVTKTLMKGGPVGALAKKLTMHALDTVAQGLQAQLSNRAQAATEKLVADMAERHEWSVNLKLGGLNATLGAGELGMAAGQLSAGVVDMFFDAGLKQIAGRGKNVRGIVEGSKQTAQVVEGQAAKGVGEASKATSKIDRGAFAKERRAHWKREASSNPSKYGADDLARMEKGKAPIGSDGHPMELHHKDRTMQGGLQPMTRTEHRLGENYKKNHPD